MICVIRFVYALYFLLLLCCYCRHRCCFRCYCHRSILCIDKPISKEMSWWIKGDWKNDTTKDDEWQWQWENDEMKSTVPRWHSFLQKFMRYILSYTTLIYCVRLIAFCFLFSFFRPFYHDCGRNEFPRTFCAFLTMIISISKANWPMINYSVSQPASQPVG